MSGCSFLPDWMSLLSSPCLNCRTIPLKSAIHLHFSYRWAWRQSRTALMKNPRGEWGVGRGKIGGNRSLLVPWPYTVNSYFLYHKLQYLLSWLSITEHRSYMSISSNLYLLCKFCSAVFVSLILQILAIEGERNIVQDPLSFNHVVRIFHG